MTVPPLDPEIAAALAENPLALAQLDDRTLAEARSQRLALLAEVPLSD